MRRGVYVARDDWPEARRHADERFALQIAAVVVTRRSPVVLSHHAAACIWGLPSVSSWPPYVDVTEPPDSARRTKNGVRIHRCELREADRVVLGDFVVTSLPRTLADLARDAPFVDAVAAFDAALDRRDPQVTREEIARHVPPAGRPGHVRFSRVLAFASELAMSPLESFSRVRIAELGFPAPVLQQEFALRKERYVDFWWPDFRVAGESDGRSKYADDPERRVWEEKLREFEFMDIGVRFTRWGWAECRDPRRLAIRLQAAGLPRSGRPLHTA